MTATRNDAQLDAGACVRRARRAWFAAGVRWRDRAALTTDLRQELAAAGDVRDVLGDDVGEAAREWASERGLTDRRLRLVIVLPAAILPGVVAGGAILATLYQAFTANGHTFMNRVGAPARLAFYLGSGVLAYLAMLAGVSAGLRIVHDGSRRTTLRTFAWTLPIAAILSTTAGVGTAAALGFDTRRLAVERVVAAVVATLVVSLAAARLLAVHRHQRMTAIARTP
jgi:ABC-type sugar transport system permease subunit